jgi:hypothetical protein
MNRAELFPQNFGGSFCIVDTAAKGTTRIERATFRTYDELVIEFCLDDFSYVVSLLRKSNTFFRGAYAIQDNAGNSGEGQVSCHIFEMPDGPFAFGIWIIDGLSCDWWAYLEPLSQTSKEPIREPVQAATPPTSTPVSATVFPPIPEFRARLTVAIPITLANGKNSAIPKGKEGSICFLHGTLQFEPDGTAAEQQMFPVEPTEIEILGFNGQKSAFVPAMGNELDAPIAHTRKRAASKVRKS